MKFTQLTEYLKYPQTIKGKLSTLHAQIIDYTIAHYESTTKFRTKVIRTMNTLSLLCVIGDSMPSNWSIDNPFQNLGLADEYTCKTTLGDGLFINYKDVEWDIDVPDDAAILNDWTERVPTRNTSAQQNTAVRNVVSNNTTKSVASDSKSKSKKRVSRKEDLYIQGPTVPRVDTSKVWFNYNGPDDVYTIYKSLPEVPTRQCEISCTTDEKSLLDNELLNLFPDHFIPTRSEVLYKPIPGFAFHDKLGFIFKIKGFTEAQVIDNIIRYPHIYQLKRMIDSTLKPFYAYVEIDGELKDIQEVWQQLDDTKDLPMTVEYMKEYTVRRYLLERDVKKMIHRYSLHGTLEPFLTLFTTPEEYASLGYKNASVIARMCVSSRISFLRSRNPILRRAGVI